MSWKKDRMRKAGVNERTNKTNNYDTQENELGRKKMIKDGEKKGMERGIKK